MTIINSQIVNGKIEPVGHIPEPNCGILFNGSVYKVFTDDVEFQNEVNALNIPIDVA